MSETQRSVSPAVSGREAYKRTRTLDISHDLESRAAFPWDWESPWEERTEQNHKTCSCGAVMEASMKPIKYFTSAVLCNLLAQGGRFAYLKRSSRQTPWKEYNKFYKVWFMRSNPRRHPCPRRRGCRKQFTGRHPWRHIVFLVGNKLCRIFTCSCYCGEDYLWYDAILSRDRWCVIEYCFTLALVIMIV